MARFILTAASFLGAVAVMLGAFGAHGLKTRLDSYSLDIFQKGVEYQYYHVFALLVIGILATKYSSSLLQWSANFMIAGILIFSGSLYLLGTKSLLGIESWSKFLGPITPIGGLFLIVGWMLLCIFAYKNV
ncbi:MAG TPA: DUF423 domain-containing protein [Chitinophagales bacterium]|nr:DUF423 domain-containing protein [Chitinophagales bacterium]